LAADGELVFTGVGAGVGAGTTETAFGGGVVGAGTGGVVVAGAVC
jgi:hypothetical protein